MCDVVSAGLLVASAASTAVGVAAQQKAAKDQRKYENNVYSATAKAANTNYIQTISQTNVQRSQVEAATGQQAVQADMAVRSAQAAQAVASGEAGATGNTMDLLLRDFDRVKAQDNFNLDTNREWRDQQTEQNLLSAQAQANNQTTSALPRPVQMPSVLVAALQIGSSAFTAYDQSQQHSRSGPYDPNNNDDNWLFKNWST